MLILERRPGEAIVLTLEDGTVVRVVLLTVESQQRCRLGVDAPRKLPIRRGELRAEKETR